MHFTKTLIQPREFHINILSIKASNSTLKFWFIKELLLGEHFGHMYPKLYDTTFNIFFYENIGQSRKLKNNSNLLPRPQAMCYFGKFMMADYFYYKSN